MTSPELSDLGPTVVVALDGPAGSGKSTVARLLADALGVGYLDTGAMYRSVAFACVSQNVAIDDEAAVAAVARQSSIHLSIDGTVMVDGVDATQAIRGPEVTKLVSYVATNPAVRSELVARQREWVVEHDGGVLEGRDIGTVVFPDALLKVYLNARPEVRAARRAGEVADADVAAIAADIARRDAIDSSRSTAPLKRADDAVEMDTSDLSIAEVVEQLVVAVRARSAETREADNHGGPGPSDG